MEILADGGYLRVLLFRIKERAAPSRITDLVHRRKIVTGS